MKTYNSYAEWFREYRENFRAEDDGKTNYEAICAKLCKDEPEFAQRLAYEKKDGDWYYTSAELVEMGKLSAGKVGA